MSFYKVTITLPRTVELTVCARDERTARRAAEEFASTAFANALRFWDDNEPISDDKGQPLGEVQIELLNQGENALAGNAIEITTHAELLQ